MNSIKFIIALTSIFFLLSASVSARTQSNYVISEKHVAGNPIPSFGMEEDSFLFSSLHSGFCKIINYDTILPKYRFEFQIPIHQNTETGVFQIQQIKKFNTSVYLFIWTLIWLLITFCFFILRKPGLQTRAIIYFFLSIAIAVCGKELINTQIQLIESSQLASNSQMPLKFVNMWPSATEALFQAFLIFGTAVGAAILADSLLHRKKGIVGKHRTNVGPVNLESSITSANKIKPIKIVSIVAIAAIISWTDRLIAGNKTGT